MQETILIAGRDRHEVHSMRRHWKRLGYASIPCRSIATLIKELEVLPTCGVRVPLVIMYPEILREPDDEMVDRLSGCSLDVPFVLIEDETEQEDQSWEILRRLCGRRVPFDQDEHPFGDVLKKANVEVVTA